MANELPLLIRYGTVMGLSLPAGKLCNGGSCAFATEACLEACYEMPDRNPRQAATLHQIETNSAPVVAGRIIAEMERAENNQLFWFASGDCPPDQTDKLCMVAETLADLGYWQNGFTRNRRFWSNTLSLPRCRIARTIEDERKALAASEHGLVALPDYEAGRTYLHGIPGIWFCGGGFGGGGFCASGFMQDDARNWFEADCGECRKNQRGCWA